MNKLYCTRCGSDDTLSRAWVNNLTKEIEEYMPSYEPEDNFCNACDDSVKLATIGELWEMFADIPVNENDELEQPFLSFPAGTSKTDVWHWFDERTPNGIAVDFFGEKPVDWDEEYTSLHRRFYQQYHQDGLSIPEAYEKALRDMTHIKSIRHTSVDKAVLDEWMNARLYWSEVMKVYEKEGMFGTENFRLCEHCGYPMKEGYYLGGEYACCEQCALALYDGDKDAMDADLSHADEIDGECYWTEWDSIILD